MADHALAVLREALTNVSKHAHATQVLVGVTLGEELRIEVTDNGVGAAVREGGAIGGGRGLRNLRSRAERLGGSLEVTDSGGAGTHLVWRVPY
jgi:signal transduction histidine kinase